MNGTFRKQIVEAIGTILALLLITVAAAGLALFLVLMISPLILRIPSHFLNLSNEVVLKDYRHLLMYLVQPWPQPSLHLAGIPMTEGAVEHFSDVRHLIITALAITGLALFGAYGIIQY